MDIFFGFVTDTKPLSDAERLVKKVGLETQKTATQVTNLGKNMRLTKGPTSALSTTAGQLGVQFQDVAVQASMTVVTTTAPIASSAPITAPFGPKIDAICGPC